jgi:hypothetical protein
MFATIVYLLCGLTSVACAVLLARAYFNSRNSLLLWSSVAFGFFSINNFFVFLDMLIFPNVDLSLFRAGSLLIGVGVLIMGLIWEST